MKHRRASCWRGSSSSTVANSSNSTRRWSCSGAPSAVRRLYQGILQIGVAFHHLRRLNHHGTVYMLTRGAGYLAPFAPSCQGVDVAALIGDAAAALAEIERLGPDRLADFNWQ